MRKINPKASSSSPKKGFAPPKKTFSKAKPATEKKELPEWVRAKKGLKGDGAEKGYPAKKREEPLRPPTAKTPEDRKDGAPERGSYSTKKAEGRSTGGSKGEGYSTKKKSKDAKKVQEPVVVPEPEIEIPVEVPTFAELGLSEPLIKAISEMGFESPTPIQARAIPVLLQGGDLIGQAQTGTGKTAAFALPILEMLNRSRLATQALILVPTRELAIQVAGGIWDLAKHTGLKVVPVYGGQPIDRQFRALRAGAHIVVGTPGRVLDHLRRGSLSLKEVIHCTLDEADEMLALGFAEDMESILGELPEQRQVACFSATMPPRIVDLTKRFLNNPTRVSI
ncbi:MAG: DEAD/DEAH box helicase, partial [Fimbriimonas sp.]